MRRRPSSTPSPARSLGWGSIRSRARLERSAPGGNARSSRFMGQSGGRGSARNLPIDPAGGPPEPVVADSQVEALESEDRAAPRPSGEAIAARMGTWETGSLPARRDTPPFPTSAPEEGREGR